MTKEMIIDELNTTLEALSGQRGNLEKIKDFPKYKELTGMIDRVIPQLVGKSLYDVVNMMTAVIQETAEWKAL